MNPDTSLLSMTADSTLPENMTNVLSGTTAVIKPGGLAADPLFNIHSEKVVVPKVEVTTLLKPIPISKTTTTVEPPTPGSSIQPTHSTSPKDLTNPINAHPLLGLPPFQMNKIPVSAPSMDVQMPYNAHLAALMRQYEMINQNSKSKPVPIGAGLESEASRRRQKESVPSPLPDNGMPKAASSIQKILQIPCRTVPPPVGMTLNDANLLNFALPMSGYGWPMLPYPNPFAMNFMQTYAYPHLSMLHNPLVFPQPPQTPLPQPTQPVTNGNSQSKKRKAPTEPTTKTQIKRAKEIEQDVLQLSHCETGLPSLPPTQHVIPSLQTAFKLK